MCRGGGRRFTRTRCRSGAGAAKLRQNLFERRKSRGIHHAQQTHFEMQALIGLAAEIVVRFEQDLEKSRQVFFAECGGGARNPRAFARGRGDQIRFRAAHFGHQQIPEVADGFAAEARQILALRKQAVHQFERERGRALLDRGGEQVERLLRHHAEQFAHLRVADGFAAIRAGLLEQRKRVAHAAFSRASHHRQRARLDVPFFLRGDLRERRGDFREGERAKMKMLRARADGVG